MDVIGKAFKHYKGNIYKIIGEAVHSETHEDLVIYQDQADVTKTWARPKEMFFENIIFEGKEVPRFSIIENI